MQLYRLLFASLMPATDMMEFQEDLFQNSVLKTGLFGIRGLSEGIFSKRVSQMLRYSLSQMLLEYESNAACSQRVSQMLLKSGSNAALSPDICFPACNRPLLHYFCSTKMFFLLLQIVTNTIPHGPTRHEAAAVSARLDNSAGLFVACKIASQCF